MSDVTKEIDGLLVEWDSKKAAINKQKHGVTLKTQHWFSRTKI